MREPAITTNTGTRHTGDFSFGTRGAPAIQALTDVECWQLLFDTTVGRLAVDVAGQPDIFPINYIVDDVGRIVFRTAAGTKLAASALLHHVAFEIDGYDPEGGEAWSVVVKGRAHLVEHMDEVFAADDLPLFPWAANPKPNFVRITPTEVSGRRFHVVDGVVPDHSIGWSSDAHDEESTNAPRLAHHPGAPQMPPD